MEHSRVIIGYHGCLEPRATDIITGRLPVSDWPPSKNKWDWLGQGVYFWEHAPERARQWAEDTARRAERRGEDAEPAVIGAVISLDRCFDLTEVSSTQALRDAYEELAAGYAIKGWALPENSGNSDDKVKRELDCTVFEWLLGQGANPIASVRGPFLEGEAAFPGSMIRASSHIQIAVRDAACIRGVFRPTF